MHRYLKVFDVICVKAQAVGFDELFSQLSVVFSYYNQMEKKPCCIETKP